MRWIMFFKSKRRKGIIMCKKLGEIHNKCPADFLKGVNSLPIDIEQILHNWKIDYASASFKDLQKALPLKNNEITGLAYAQGDDLLILYSKSSNKSDSRFTLAHELAHCCLHMNVDSSCHIELQTVGDVLNISMDKFRFFNRSKEQEADRFARDLLIPTNVLLLLLKRNPKISLKQLATFFVVPIEQMHIKLQEL